MPLEDDIAIAIELLRLLYRCCGTERLGVGLDAATLRERVSEFNMLNGTIFGHEDLDDEAVPTSRRARIFQRCTIIIMDGFVGSIVKTTCHPALAFWMLIFRVLSRSGRYVQEDTNDSDLQQ